MESIDKMNNKLRSSIIIIVIRYSRNHNNIFSNYYYVRIIINVQSKIFNISKYNGLDAHERQKHRKNFRKISKVE